VLQARQVQEKAGTTGKAGMIGKAGTTGNAGTTGKQAREARQARLTSQARQAGRHDMQSGTTGREMYIKQCTLLKVKTYSTFDGIRTSLFKIPSQSVIDKFS
jgi:hypothetical protein